MDQGCAEGFRGISRRRAGRHAERSHDSHRGEQIGQGKAVVQGVDGGVFEIALGHRGDAFRVIYAVKISADIWVIHAFQKKSKTGIKTPQMEADLIRERLKRFKEALR